MKTIAIVSYDFRPNIGGVSTVAHELALAYHEQGLKVHVLTGSQVNDATFDQSVPYTIHRTKLRSKAIWSIYPMAQLIKGVSTSVQPELFISLLWMPDGLAIKFSGIKTKWIQYAHGVEVLESFSSPKKIIRSLFSPIKKWVFRSADKVICVSHFTKNLVLKFTGVSEQNIYVAYNGVNLKNFKPATNEEAQILKTNLKIEKTITFLTVCRLNPYKGVDKVIEALHFLKNQNYHPDYIIAGDGKDLERLKILAKTLKVENQVRFIPSPSDEVVKALYQSCDCFMLLTRSDWKKPNVEGFGLVFLEAAACAKMSIGGNSGGIPDAIEDQVTGYLAPPEEPEKIAELMKRVIDSPEQRKKMNMAALKRVTESYSWNNISRNILNALK